MSVAIRLQSACRAAGQDTLVLNIRNYRAVAVVAALFLPLPAQGRAQAPALHDFVARVAGYVTNLTPKIASVVAVEHYQQRLWPSTSTRTIRLKSDFLLVRPGDAANWIMFRDVVEVNGKPIRYEEDRLVKLFGEPDADVAGRISRIVDESLRFHLPGGSVAVTNPFLVVALMHPHYQPRLAFTMGGEDRRVGRDVRVLRFEEREPRTSPNSAKGAQAPPILDSLGLVRGSVWAEQETGRIVKTEVRIGRGTRLATNTTTFVQNDRLGVMVPREMRTSWRELGSAPVEGVATYDGFRQFEVRTEAAIAGMKEQIP